MEASRVKSIMRTAARIVVPLGATAVATYLLYRYEYFAALGAVDNVIGAMPIAFMAVFVACATTLSNIKYEKRFIALYAVLAAFAVLSLALFPNALRGNWWFGKYDSSIGARADVAQYAPFTDGNKIAKLGEPSTLKLSGELPVLDGALALYPVYSAVAETVYDEAEFTQESVMFTDTLKAFDAVVAGERDIAFLAGASEAQMASARARGRGHKVHAHRQRGVRLSRERAKPRRRAYDQAGAQRVFRQNVGVENARLGGGRQYSGVSASRGLGQSVGAGTGDARLADSRAAPAARSEPYRQQQPHGADDRRMEGRSARARLFV